MYISEQVSKILAERRAGLFKQFIANPKTIERAKNIKKIAARRDLKRAAIKAAKGSAAVGTGVAAGVALDRKMTPRGDK